MESYDKVGKIHPLTFLETITQRINPFIRKKLPIVGPNCMKFFIWLDIHGNFFSMHIVAPKKAKLTTSTKGFEEHPTTLIMRKEFF
jgi:hypothetical protein